MSLARFLKDLHENGRVRVAKDAIRTGKARAETEAALREMDAAARAEMPGDAPALDLPAADWAARMLYQACRFLVHREVPGAAVVEALSEPCPAPTSPSVCYSVDLAFRYLPDLISMARGIAAEDPLVTSLNAFASAWPLSSVGVREAEAPDGLGFWSDPALRRLYVDRILERRDLARLEREPVREAAREALGLHRELAPAVAAALAEPAPRKDPS